MITGRLVRLIWGLNASRTLVAVVRPSITLVSKDRKSVPRLLGIDRESFEKFRFAGNTVGDVPIRALRRRAKKC